MCFSQLRLQDENVVITSYYRLIISKSTEHHWDTDAPAACQHARGTNVLKCCNLPFYCPLNSPWHPTCALCSSDPRPSRGAIPARAVHTQGCKVAEVKKNHSVIKVLIHSWLKCHTGCVGSDVLHLFVSLCVRPNLLFRLRPESVCSVYVCVALIAGLFLAVVTVAQSF